MMKTMYPIKDVLLFILFQGVGTLLYGHYAEHATLDIVHTIWIQAWTAITMWLCMKLVHRWGAPVTISINTPQCEYGDGKSNTQV